MDNEDENDVVNGDIHIGFDDQTEILHINKIIPLKLIPDTVKRSIKYKQILTSMKAIGIIEPPVISRESSKAKQFILLDGHLRIEALKEMGIDEVACLVAKDDEAFTYNKHINRLTIIQEHKMILKAIERGVPGEKIAEALGVNVKSIVQKQNLLEGICEEATELLKDKMTPITVFGILRKMKPLRQIDVVKLMNDAGTYSNPYAQALLAATPKDQLVNPEKPKKIKGISEEQMERMEQEMASLEKEYRLIEDSYGTDLLNLTVAKGYLSKLLQNVSIVKYLAGQHAEILAEFQKISEMKALEEITQ